MYSFEDIEFTEAPLTSGITPIKGGTPNVFLKKFEWATPPGKVARLELTLERRYKPTGATEMVIENSRIMFNDPTHQEKGLPICREQYARIILAYRPDMTLESLRKAVGTAETWQELTMKTFALLPEGFPMMESTWKLIYYKGQGTLTVDTRYIVKLGTHELPWNDTYDHLKESVEARNKRRQTSGLKAARSAEEAAIISQQNQPKFISDEELFG